MILKLLAAALLGLAAGAAAGACAGFEATHSGQALSWSSARVIASVDAAWHAGPGRAR